MIANRRSDAVVDKIRELNRKHNKAMSDFCPQWHSIDKRLLCQIGHIFDIASPI